MEKQATKSKIKIMKFLPNVAQAVVSFQNPPFSPGREKHRSHFNKGFSGPILPMIPVEARRKSRNFETQEPTSPKVSCIGQIKQKKKNSMSKKKQNSLPRELKPDNILAGAPPPDLTKKPKPSGIKKIFSSRRKSDASADRAKPPAAERAPSLGQMRRFASSRDTFANFDWTNAQIAPEEDRHFYSDEERGYSDGEEDFKVPFSAPILSERDGGRARAVALEPRKEINLWKRRTMAQPKPLKLDVLKEL